MDLPTAAKRYEQVRTFWAREIAQILLQRGASSQIAALRRLAAQGEPLRGDNLLPSPEARYNSDHSRATSTRQLCRSLLEGALVTRQRHSLGQSSRPFFYTLSELGRLVLAYIPEEYGIVRKKKPAEIINGEGREIPAEIINGEGREIPAEIINDDEEKNPVEIINGRGEKTPVEIINHEEGKEPATPPRKKRGRPRKTLVTVREEW